MMRSHLRHAMFVISAATAVIAPDRARACSPLPAYLVHQRTVAPADGAIGVPLNAEVIVAYDANLGMMTVPIDHPELRLGTGEPGPRLTNANGAVVFLLSPPVLLLPNTRYEILSEVAKLPCVIPSNQSPPASYPLCWPTSGADGGAGGGTLDAGVVDSGSPPDGSAVPSTVVASFTTGEIVDETKPSPPGPMTIAKQPTECYGGGCCFAYEGVHVSIQWEAAPDDTAVGYYEISSADGRVMPLQTVTWTEGIVMCHANGTFGGIDSPGKYQVVAVDLAGNRSLPATIDLSNACDEGCGCHIGGRPQGASGPALAAGILLLCFGRRRRGACGNAQAEVFNMAGSTGA
jgi:hypothetical protein